MIVAELVELLQRLPQDKVVSIAASYSGIVTEIFYDEEADEVVLSDYVEDDDVIEEAYEIPEQFKPLFNEEPQF